MKHIKNRRFRKIKRDPILKVLGIGQGNGQAMAKDYETYLYGGMKNNKK